MALQQKADPGRALASAGGYITIFLRLLVFSNIYIVVCSVVMSVQTFLYFSLPINLPLIAFIASGTLCSYSMHWALPSSHNTLSQREQWSFARRRLLLVLFGAGFILSVYFFIELKQYWSGVLPLVVLTFLYSSGKLPAGPFRYLRKYFFGKTIYLAAMWTLVTVYLPIMVSAGRWELHHCLFTGSRFFFLFAICILFDLRDREADSAGGIKSLITFLERSGIRKLYYSSLLISCLSALALYYYVSVIPLLILLLPTAAAASVYSYSVQTRSELWFYFFLDGLMMLSGILIIACCLV